MYTTCYVDLWQYKHNRYSRRKSLSLGLKKSNSTPKPYLLGQK